MATYSEEIYMQATGTKRVKNQNLMVLVSLDFLVAVIHMVVPVIQKGFSD